MPTVRIDHEVWQELQKRAVPFKDTPNTVLRRLLKLDGQPTPQRPPYPVGKQTPQREFWRPILEILIAMGGGGRTSDVLERVREKMKDKLKSEDYREVTGGEPRWRNSARVAREGMKGEKLLKSNSSHGYWEITETGREYLKRASST